MGSFPFLLGLGEFIKIETNPYFFFVGCLHVLDFNMLFNIYACINVLGSYAHPTLFPQNCTHPFNKKLVYNRHALNAC